LAQNRGVAQPWGMDGAKTHTVCGGHSAPESWRCLVLRMDGAKVHTVGGKRTAPESWRCLVLGMDGAKVHTVGGGRTTSESWRCFNEGACQVAPRVGIEWGERSRVKWTVSMSFH
jgi:hypothetical protein